MEVVNENPILSKIFILDKTSNNEVYLSLYLYLLNNYKHLLTPIAKHKQLINELSKEVMNYYETLYGIDFKGKYKIILRPTINNMTYIHAKKSDKTTVQLKNDNLKKYSPLIYKKVDVRNKSINVVMFRPSSFTVIIDPRVPLINALYIISHELAHVYTLNQVWQPLMNLQMIGVMSTTELLAVIPAYKYLTSNNIYYHFGMPSNIMHYEYYTYSIDFLKNERNIIKFTQNLIENGLITNTESVERYNFTSIIKIMKFYNLLYRITVNEGSFIREIPLESLLTKDYMFFYYLLNYNEFMERFKKVYEFTDKIESSIEIYNPEKGLTNLKKLLLYFKNKVLDRLIYYNREKNTVKEKQPYEKFLFGDIVKEDKLLLH